MGGVAKPAEGRFRFYRNKYRHRYLDNFYFVHINKTGGTSIENALGIPHEHRTAAEKITKVGLARWRRRFTFGIVRNPWDRVVSQYFFRVRARKTGLPDSGMGFGEWCERCYLLKDWKYRDVEKMFIQQLEWLSSGDGALLVDYVGRFEDLDGSFDYVLRQTGIEATLPHLNRTDRKGYRHYYDEKTRNIVSDAFADDIEAFGYQF